MLVVDRIEGNMVVVECSGKYGIKMINIPKEEILGVKEGDRLEIKQKISEINTNDYYEEKDESSRS